MIKDLITYATSLEKDIIDQFRDKPNTEALVKVLSRQLQQVYDFYLQLATLLSINECSGVQLDNIGSIVQLTRAEARALAKESDFSYSDEDEMYRAFLHYKIFVNTADCTYEDVMNSIYMMWDGKIGYEEDENIPATIILGYEMWNGDNHRRLMNIPILKAAGVQIMFRARAILRDHLKVGGGAVYGNDVYYEMTQRTALPNYLLDEIDTLMLDENYEILCEDGDDR